MPRLVIYPKDSASYSPETCSAVFPAPLSTVGREWKPPKCPMTNEWVDGWVTRMRCMYTLKCSAVNKNEICR